MDRVVFSYLDIKYRYLSKYIEEFNKSIFVEPLISINKGKFFLENLSDEILNEAGKRELKVFNSKERVAKLKDEGILENNIYEIFMDVFYEVDKEESNNKRLELRKALKIHKDLYDITCWFVKRFIDNSFVAEEYKYPMVSDSQDTFIDKDEILTIINECSENGRQYEEHMYEVEEASTELLVDSIFYEDDKKCLVQELARLKESSKEAVEGLGEFTSFKNYMHIKRDTQTSLEELIEKSCESDKSQLILVCGSVGDGKSHVISYCKNHNPKVGEYFKIHNDATESLEPDKTSMDTLNEVLDDFSDEKIEESNTKFILAINLGTLTNFIDSKYGDRFTKLKKFVKDKKILESSIEESNFDENSNFQFVNFSDYHVFTLKDGKVHSEFVKSIIDKITKSSTLNSRELNTFYISYNMNCKKCENKSCCPIKANYELLAKDEVQTSIIDLIVQCIVKNKIIISTRALLNFIYELIVPRSYVDVNSPTFKNSIGKLNNQDYINSLMPNVIFDHKELSFIFAALNNLDPLNIRNEQVDNFIIDFNNTNEVIQYFNEYLDYPDDYIAKVENVNFAESQDKKLKPELLKLFIRSYGLCAKKELFSLRDDVYDEYMNALFYWNKGDKPKLKKAYDNVKNGIVNWNGEADKEHMNIFMGKNQIKYKVSEEIELKADTSNLVKKDEYDLKKFIGTLKLKYKGAGAKESYEIDVDYPLYKLLTQINQGYRPNKRDRNQFIKFIEFINKLQESGSQDEKLIFTEKNKDNNHKFKLEYDEEFENYRFVEI